MTRLRCAIYTRKSSDEGLEQEFNSLHAQREACEAFIKSQKHEGWQLIKTAYDDGGISGGTMERPALKNLLADISLGLVDIVVVYKVDRLTRSLADFAKMVELFDKHKVSFVSVTQQFNTTSSMGRLTLNVLLSFAQFEREVTGERIRDKISASKKKGMWMGGFSPLGYDIVEKKLIPNSTEAQTVKYIYESYLELGSVRELAEHLQQQGIYSKSRDNATRPGGAEFSRGALYHLLANPLYIGKIRFKGSLYYGQHEGIISQELWDAVQQHMASNREGAVKSYTISKNVLLVRKLFDAVTQEALVVVHANKKGRKYRYYISGSLRNQTRRDNPNAWRIPAQEIEVIVASSVKQMLLDTHAIADTAQASSLPANYLPSIINAAKQIADDEQRIFQLINRVNLQNDSITISVSINSLMPDNTIHLPSITKTFPITIKRKGVEMKMVINGSKEPSPANHDNKLIAAIAKANIWLSWLTSGDVASIAEIADIEKNDRTYVARIIKLAFLAPEIVEQIISGKQPITLNVEKLTKQIDLPYYWNEQRRIIVSL